jgi:hypothetical protein
VNIDSEDCIKFSLSPVKAEYGQSPGNSQTAKLNAFKSKKERLVGTKRIKSPVKQSSRALKIRENKKIKKELIAMEAVVETVTEEKLLTPIEND